MPDEKEDLEEAPVVEEPDLTAPVVEEQPPVLANGTSQDKDVPYNKFKEANEAKKAAEAARATAQAEAKQYRDQLAVMQANQAFVQSKQPGRVSNYEQALRDTGLIGQDYLTQEETIKVSARKEELDMQAVHQQNVIAMNQQFVAAHPDYYEAVGTVNPYSQQFVPSAELQKILTENPHLQASCGTAQGAYKIVMQQRKVAELMKQSATLAEHQNQEQIDANLAPMSGPGGGGGATKELVKANATADDIRALEHRVKAGEFG